MDKYIHIHVKSVSKVWRHNLTNPVFVRVAEFVMLQCNNLAYLFDYKKIAVKANKHNSFGHLNRL